MNPDNMFQPGILYEMLLLYNNIQSHTLDIHYFLLNLS